MAPGLRLIAFRPPHTATTRRTGPPDIPRPAQAYAAFNPNPITILTPAAASPGTVTGTTTNLSVAANDIQGEANMIYDWSVTSLPVGATYPTFSVNDTMRRKTPLPRFMPQAITPLL